MIRSLSIFGQRPVSLGVLTACLVTACAPAVNEDGIARRTVREINSVFLDTAITELALSPETATRLGMEESRLGFTFNQRLDDRSQARFERTRLIRLELLDRLTDLPALPDDSGLGRHLDVILAEYRDLTRLEAYGFGRYGPGYARPYAVDQLSGAWTDVPDLLVSSQPLASHDDAEDYLDRLAALPGAIADERRRLMSDADNGIIPPRFVLERLEAHLRAFTRQPIDAHPLLQNFGNVVAGLEPEDGRTANDYRGAAVRVMLDDVIPAYTAFADEVAALAARAPETPGLGNLPDGEAYYRDVLAYYTQPGADPDFLHETGLTAVDQITAEIAHEFDTLGLTAGSVTERLARLSASPGQRYEATEEDRAAVLALLDAEADAAWAAMPDILDTPIEDTLLVTRMPAYREAVFTGAAYVPATANGSSPGLFQINLRDMADWPRFTLATLLHHEGVPGHHIESVMTSKQTRLPLLRQMIWNTAYGEGWAVYAEDLADANGLYANDPLGRIGYLQSILFRAARLVVDTGIHARGWSREQAVDYLVETTGLPRDAMEREVARYAVWPGQAAAYFAGRERILDMRHRAEAVLGGRFDAAAFNTALLTGGPRPLALVEQDVEAWYDDILQP
ncbi:DUF885 domain-containing protein [Henriciella aquimarina]|uniref:DUF885 domain-containing protein n=1 Tax=Henriciella aquimarina TaxID=545261 RepID=UPI000A019788|nr:DUF885 domain-containing protein [Henriciella aquimarina]